MQLAEKRYRFGYATLTTPYSRSQRRNRRFSQNADIQFTKEIEENGKLPFSRMFGKPRQQGTARQYTENRRIPTDYLTNHPTTRPRTKPRL